MACFHLELNLSPGSEHEQSDVCKSSIPIAVAMTLDGRSVSEEPLRLRRLTKGSREHLLEKGQSFIPTFCM